MKLKDLQAIPEAKQRIIMAELDGYKPHEGHEGERWVTRDGRFSVHYTGLPDYLVDLNAIEAAEKRAGLHNEENHALRVKWANNLHAILAPRCPKNKVGTPLVSDIHKMLASAADRTQALILTLTNP